MFKLWLLSVVALNFLFRLTFIPFSFIMRPTRRWPTANPNSFNSSVIRGRPIVAEGLLKLIPDMGDHDHVFTLAGAHRAVAPSAIAARADIHDLAQTDHWQFVSVFLDEGKPHSLTGRTMRSMILRGCFFAPRTSWPFLECSFPLRACDFLFVAIAICVNIFSEGPRPTSIFFKNEIRSCNVTVDENISNSNGVAFNQRVQPQFQRFC